MANTDLFQEYNKQAEAMTPKPGAPTQTAAAAPPPTTTSSPPKPGPYEPPGTTPPSPLEGNDLYPYGSGATTPAGPATPSAGVPSATPTSSPPPFTGPNATTPDYSAAQGMAGQAPGVTSEQTVQGQLGSLFANRDTNPLWQYAQSLGTQFANTRGLANSSMAAEAGAQAVFAQAVPIATADAGTNAARAQQEAAYMQASGLQAQGYLEQAGLQAQGATIQSALQAQGNLESLAQLAAQGDINSRLQLEQFGYNFDLSEQDNLHNMQIAALQGDIQAKLALQKFGFDVDLMSKDFGHRANLMDMELRNALGLQAGEQSDMLERMAIDNAATLEQIAATGAANTSQDAAQFTMALQQHYLGAVETRTGQFSYEVTQIYQTQGLTPVQQQMAVETARRNYEADIKFIQDQYSNAPGWDPAFGMEPPSSAPSYQYPGGPSPDPGGPASPPLPGEIPYPWIHFS